MAKYLISFPSAAMVVPDGEWGAVGHDAHVVIEEAKAAGVYVFGGGVDENVPPVLVSANGTVTDGGYPWAPRSTAASLCSNCLRVRRLSSGPRASRKPAAVRKSCVSSGSTRNPEWRGQWSGRCGLTIHSSRRRFAVRLNSSVRQREGK
jgi:hypothetical protein